MISELFLHSGKRIGRREIAQRVVVDGFRFGSNDNTVSLYFVDALAPIRDGKDSVVPDVGRLGVAFCAGRCFRGRHVVGLWLHNCIFVNY